MGPVKKNASEVGYGGVMIDQEKDKVWGFSQEMGDFLKFILTEHGAKKQIIGQAEIYPMLVARQLLSDKLRHRDVIHYVDNDAARYGTVKGYSPISTSAWLIHAFWDSEIQYRTRSWLSRVLTASNIADAPSRGDKKSVEKIFPNIVWLEWNSEREFEEFFKWYDLRKMLA